MIPWTWLRVWRWPVSALSQGHVTALPMPRRWGVSSQVGLGWQTLRPLQAQAVFPWPGGMAPRPDQCLVFCNPQGPEGVGVPNNTTSKQYTNYIS